MGVEFRKGATYSPLHSGRQGNIDLKSREANPKSITVKAGGLCPPLASPHTELGAGNVLSTCGRGTGPAEGVALWVVREIIGSNGSAMGRGETARGAPPFL